MDRKIVKTKKAPDAVGPYNQAVISGGFLFSAGQIGLDPETMQIVEGGVVRQARQVMSNLQAILTEAGLRYENVVKTTIYLTTMDHFAAVNEVYASAFDGEPPARSTVAVAGLPLGALVEIDVVVRVPEQGGGLSA